MNIINVVELVISIISVVVVIYGALIAFLAIVKTEFMRLKGKYSILRLRVIRADLGTYLLLGLELLIAADVLKTILELKPQGYLIKPAKKSEIVAKIIDVLG